MICSDCKSKDIKKSREFAESEEFKCEDCGYIWIENKKTQNPNLFLVNPILGSTNKHFFCSDYFEEEIKTPEQIKEELLNLIRPFSIFSFFIGEIDEDKNEDNRNL